MNLMTAKGKFIVIYGMNNLGKTTLTTGVVDYLKRINLEAVYLKYPLYDLEPTGPRVNDYLRQGNPEGLTPIRFQALMVQNRRDYQPELERRLTNREWIVAEDYKGTGIAWGVIFDVPLFRMEELNRGLFEPDLAIMLDGKRFSDGIESDHIHEGSSEIWTKGRGVFSELAKRYAWPVVNANQTKEKVLADVLDIVRRQFSLHPEGQINIRKEVK